MWLLFPVFCTIASRCNLEFAELGDNMDNAWTYWVIDIAYKDYWCTNLDLFIKCSSLQAMLVFTWSLFDEVQNSKIPFKNPWNDIPQKLLFTTISDYFLEFIVPSL